MSDWHKSSYSGGSNECVEVREHTAGAQVRDTHHRDHGHLSFPLAEWETFIDTLRSGL